MKNDEIIAKILAVLDELRPFLLSDGGDVTFINFEDGIVYLKLSGACAKCDFMDITLKDGIEQMLMNEIEEVKEVRNVEDDI